MYICIYIYIYIYTFVGICGESPITCLGRSRSYMYLNALAFIWRAAAIDSAFHVENWKGEGFTFRALGRCVCGVEV